MRKHIYALTSNQGTAMAETALCKTHYRSWPLKCTACSHFRLHHAWDDTDKIYHRCTKCDCQQYEPLTEAKTTP